MAFPCEFANTRVLRMTIHSNRWLLSSIKTGSYFFLGTVSPVSHLQLHELRTLSDLQISPQTDPFTQTSRIDFSEISRIKLESFWSLFDIMTKATPHGGGCTSLQRPRPPHLPSD